MTVEEAVIRLRADPSYAQVMRDAYLDQDVEAAARRFERSGEFAEVRRLLGGRLLGSTILDLGAGTGIGSFALARAGARQVVALEPDPSEVVGQGAIRRACTGMTNVHVLSALGEALPFGTGRFDIVYARQVLHHATDLEGIATECARVLRPGGVFLACREHVVDDALQLEQFLNQHLIHQLAGGEHAWGLVEYVSALSLAGLEVRGELGHWDSVINAFPTVANETERLSHARDLLERRFGLFGRVASLIPGVERAVWRRVDRAFPGRLYTFFCNKPTG